MSGMLAGILGLVILLVLLFVGMHIGIAMSLVGFFGIYLMKYQTFKVLPTAPSKLAPSMLDENTMVRL